MNNKLAIKKLYKWHATNGSEHVIAAKSLNDAKQILLQQETFFVKLTFKGYITKRSFQKPELITITKQLATMLKVGLPIVESLTLLAQQHPLIQWQWILSELKKNIMSGSPLSLALAQYPAIFSGIYSEIIATGELTGQLEQSFESMAVQLENHQQLQKKLKKASSYPLFLLIVSILVTLVMLLVVLPQFVEVYQNFDAQLPLFTQMVIGLSDHSKKYFIHLLILGVSIGLFYHGYLKKRYQQEITKYSLHIPIIGKMITSACLAQIFQTLFITQKSGIPLLSGLEAAQKSINNMLFRASLVQIITTIREGKTFSQAINLHPIYPNLCYQLIHVGEESGTLEIMLERLAYFYRQQSMESADNLSTKIEPLMMSIMAIIIGSLVIAMYLPVFQLGSVIH